MLHGLLSLQVGGVHGLATQQPSRFDSGRLNYSVIIPSSLSAVQVTADFFGGLRASTPIVQTVTVSLEADGKLMELRDGITSELPLPLGLQCVAVVVHVSSKIGADAFQTSYTVSVHRASQIATVTGTGFVMQTVAPTAGGSPFPVAWRDRNWTYSSLPAAFFGMHYTMLTCLEEGGSCGTGRHLPVNISASIHCMLHVIRWLSEASLI